jgi:predicted ester cyclase
MKRLLLIFSLVTLYLPYSFATSEIENNKMAIQEFYKAVVENNQKTLPEFFEKNYQIIDVGSMKDVKGSHYAETNPDINMRISLLHKAMPKFNIKITQLIGEKNKIFADVIMQGKQEGNFMGVVPTHKILTFHSFVVYTFNHGKIIKAEELLDEYSVMRQMGYIVLN